MSNEEKDKTPFQRLAPLLVTGAAVLVLSGFCIYISAMIKTILPKVFLAIMAFTGLVGGLVMVIVAIIFLYAIFYENENL